MALDEGQDTLALDSGRLVEAEAVDSSEDLLFQAHVVEGVY